MISWHRLFHITVTDYFVGTNHRVENEIDLSLMEQLLDLVIIKTEKGKTFREEEICDGLENLSHYNLITFKSLWEPLSPWFMDELVGHYVSYRKKESAVNKKETDLEGNKKKKPSSQKKEKTSSLEDTKKKLIRESEFSLYAVCMRYPRKLAAKTKLEKIKKGVYKTSSFSKEIRIIVLSQISKEDKNTIWLLFSGNEKKVQYGASHHQWRIKELSSLIDQLYQKYNVEGVPMAYTIEDYKRETVEDGFFALPAPEQKETLKKLFRERQIEERVEILKDFPIEERFKGIPLEKIEEYLKNARQ